MLPFPKIERRQIDRLKSNRSIKVHQSKSSNTADENVNRTLPNRRASKRERRKQDMPVEFERRREDRRRAFLRNSRKMREILSHSGGATPTPSSRQGMYIDEVV